MNQISIYSELYSYSPIQESELRQTFITSDSPGPKKIYIYLKYKIRKNRKYWNSIDGVLNYHCLE